MLQEAIAKAEGEDGTAEEERELEELKQLLPEIREKVEDAAESQRTASAASQAIQQALVSTRVRRDSTHVSSGSVVTFGPVLAGWSLNVISIPM